MTGDNAAAARKKIIYIVSPRYSGSTLLCYLLTTDPAVSTIGERKKFFNKTIRVERGGAPSARVTSDTCSCGQPFVSCPYWLAVLARLRPHLRPADGDRDFTQFQLSGDKRANQVMQRIHGAAMRVGLAGVLPWRRRVERLCTLNRALIDTILELDGNRVFVDSSKMVRHLQYLREVPDYDIHVVNLIRDPRAQVASAMKRNPWNAARAARELAREARINESVLKALKLPVTDVSYEALCADPMGTVARIFADAGVDVAPSPHFRARERHVMGNVGTRFERSNEVRERVTWPDELAAADVQAIEAIAAPVLARSRELTATR